MEKTITNTLKLFSNRKIVIWGKCKAACTLKKIFYDNFKIETAFYVDNNKNLINKRDTFSPEVLRNKSEEYFVVIPIGFHKSLKGQLIEYGYKKNADYYYFADCVIEDRDDYFEDENGNKIIGYHKGVNITFLGCNSIIMIGERASLIGVRMKLDGESELSIGNDSEIKDCFFDFNGNDIHCSIGSESIIAKGHIRLFPGSQFHVGNHFTSCENLCVRQSGKSYISIGNDCMFSYDIELRGSDGHSIFDVVERKNINSTEEIRKRDRIIIGNHVWVGMRSLILYNTEVGDGSIIGANSLVKSRIPNNCIAAGIPAKVIRKNICWSRKNGSEDIMDCGEEYINLTDEM